MGLGSQSLLLAEETGEGSDGQGCALFGGNPQINERDDAKVEASDGLHSPLFSCTPSMRVLESPLDSQINGKQMVPLRNMAGSHD